jgi:hypothetical protein
MIWLIRMAFVMFLLLGCGGTFGDDIPRDGCGDWRENPELLGKWIRDYDMAFFTLTDDSQIRYNESPTTYAYAVCVYGGVDILEVNEVRLTYVLSGDSLLLSGNFYMRAK